ncbi:predicted protein [Thalassiosira pseudonana CCMP1335]|uniref:Uncharacterized protein n=1 Tax=Thalassiosira pseudonana TaxID=35128 RepID=B8LE73_THAPS|nr:predicted protein [Thalassiosira pseudonana CCMP1335]XP_002297335.1 predicted protein [Thalassiosira pseudonana CCMP1335]EED86363.1 predicted protein [Thalassiosira pseudonana CCMP1335]EED86376.1 predicted protein [Thalassiosira pseudonana CCMP1335]|eukprot:scaffold6614_cov230-Alexandrium_tamarense.AAC.3
MAGCKFVEFHEKQVSPEDVDALTSAVSSTESIKSRLRKNSIGHKMRKCASASKEQMKEQQHRQHDSTIGSTERTERSTECSRINTTASNATTSSATAAEEQKPRRPSILECLFDDEDYADGIVPSSKKNTNSDNQDDIKQDQHLLSQVNRRSSWIRSSGWDEHSYHSYHSSDDDDDDNDSITSLQDLDDSLYQLLEDGNSEIVLVPSKKMSLHSILVEEELSFQRSLVWQDNDTSGLGLNDVSSRFGSSGFSIE